MTPEEFERRMRDVEIKSFVTNRDTGRMTFDMEAAGDSSEKVIRELLRELGYNAGVDIIERWTWGYKGA